MRQGQATPTSRTPIGLDQLGGDVWAWQKQLAGSCAGIQDDATVELRVNGGSVPVERTADRFSAMVRLIPGENVVTAIATLANGDRIAAEPVTHTVRLSPRPTSRITVSVEGASVVLDGVGSEASEFDGAPIVSWSWTARSGNPAPLRDVGSGDALPQSEMDDPDATPAPASDDGGATISVGTPEEDGEYYVSLRVTDEAGRSDTSTACFVVERGTARAVDPVTEEAAWVESAVVYGMVVRNFTSDEFRGVTERLQELQDLGVTAIWFAPITRTIQNLFGYEVTDYFDVRPEYGTLEDFRELVQQAHARDMKILMDFVPNHTSYRHPYFEDAVAHGEASPYYDFFDRDEGGGVTHYFEWSHLPNLNFDNPEVRRFMTEAFTFWVREYDVDGFRADVAWGIKERRPDYWLAWSAEMNRIKPDSLLIAEASARDPFYVHNGFDAAYDWTDELGVWAWGDAFAYGFPMSMAMPDALTNGGEGYDPDSLVFRFLNNNDTDMRFVSIYGVNYYRVALAMMLTLPGIPCLYTGDEVGAQFLPYETLGEIDWSDPNELRPFVRRLVQLRRANPGLYSRTWSQLEAEPSVEIFAYLREGEGARPIAVVLNFSAGEIDATVTMPPSFAGFDLIDLWTDEPVAPPASGKLMVPVPAWGFRILTARPD
jgi:cyclomaltodextrinase / maltogenic alpha-amylase / neopullulanase